MGEGKRMTSKQRAYLRGLANTADTILIIGKDGVTDNVLKQADDAVEAREIIKLKCGRKICSLVRFPKIQLTPNGLSAQQIKLQTKDNHRQVKAGISRLNAKPQ